MSDLVIRVSHPGGRGWGDTSSYWASQVPRTSTKTSSATTRLRVTRACTCSLGSCRQDKRRAPREKR